MIKNYPWGNDRPFNSYASWCLAKYGTRLQKLSIDAGFTCPNRDGSKGTGGCSFCLNDAFNPSYCHPQKTISQQITEGIEFHKTRYRRASQYIAYFQAYSNTYQKTEELITIYDQALSIPEISGIAIGTRPDCLNNSLLDYLAALSERKHVSLELGIESCYNVTLKRINRGHDFESTKDALERCKIRNIFTTGHLIFGLPGETIPQMLKQADIISKLPIQSLKLHQLQIIKGTAIEKEYETYPESFNLFSLPEYINFIIQFLERLSPDITIERLSSEVPPRFLATSPWCNLRADQVSQQIESAMKQNNSFQGKYHSQNL